MHRQQILATVLLGLAAAACGVGGPAATATPPAATYAEADAAMCAAFGSLLRAVGNPDTGTSSPLSEALDAAVEAHDPVAAATSGAQITAELEKGREQAAVAARWAPAETPAKAMDTLLLAYEAAISAKQLVAAGTAGADEPGTQFGEAGGREAWTAFLQGMQSLPVPAGASPAPCKAYSGTP